MFLVRVGGDRLIRRAITIFCLMAQWIPERHAPSISFPFVGAACHMESEVSQVDAEGPLFYSPLYSFRPPFRNRRFDGEAMKGRSINSYFLIVYIGHTQVRTRG